MVLAAALAVAAPELAQAADVTGSALFDVFGFQLSASATFDVLCEIINPFLKKEHRLSSCAGQALADESVDESVNGTQAVDPSQAEVITGNEGSFAGGNTGNLATGIGGAAIGGVAGGSGPALESLTPSGI